MVQVNFFEVSQLVSNFLFAGNPSLKVAKILVQLIQTPLEAWFNQQEWPPLLGAMVSAKRLTVGSRLSWVVKNHHNTQQISEPYFTHW